MILDMHHLREIFIYDESVPSCLRWKVAPSKSHPYLKGKMAGCKGKFGRYQIRIPKYKEVTSPRIVYQMHFGNLKETDYIFLRDQNNGSVISNIIKLDAEFVFNCINKRSSLKFWDLFYYKSGKLFWKIYNFTGSLSGVINLKCLPDDLVNVTLREDGYVSTNHPYIKGQTKFYHRIVWMVCHQKELSRNEEIDHIDGNKCNNNIENLRLVTRSTNSRNTKFNKLNTSGVKGVYLCKTGHSLGWRAFVIFDGKKSSKLFNINKYGNEVSFELAKQWRNDKISELNLLYGDSAYTDRHERGNI